MNNKKEDFINLDKSEKITILFLSWRDIKHPKKGGAEVFTHEMLKLINHNKYRIVHFGPCVAENPDFEIIDGIAYLRKGNPITVIPYAILYYLKNKKNIAYVVDQCNTHHFFTPLWVGKNKRIFFIHQFTREIWCININSPICKVGEYTETPFIALSKNDHTISVSGSTKKELIDIGFKPEKIHILPEGIEFEHWKKDKFLEKEKDPTFIFVGRYINYKGIDDTILAFGILKKYYPNAKLWIVGKKDQSYIDQHLKKIFEKENLSYGDEKKNDVVLFGFVSNEMKLELMSKAHCLIFPSQREGWGLIITEAAAVGTPSIVYNSPGIVDAVDYGKTGFMCKENSPNAIADYMKKIFDDKEMYENMREEAYQFSLKFHWRHTAKSFDDFMEKLIGITPKK